jgi:CBS domain-containing protein
MIYPVDKLIAEQKLLCAFEGDTVRDALAKMVANDYSQLPVVDQQKNLTGIISEQAISRSYYHLGDKVGLLDLKVSDCNDKPATLPLESDVLEAFEILRRVTAVVIVEGRRPVGILTNADAVDFFRNLSEGLVLIEDIETTLRQYIDETFRSTEDRERALHNAFKHLLKGEGSSMPTYDLMTFGDYVNLISNARNWEQFEHQLDSKDLFRTYMDQVREIRNQLTHFRGQLDAIQYDMLRRARGWLAGRRRRLGVQPQTVIAEPKARYITESREGKYGPFQDWLKAEGKNNPAERTIALTFAQIEEIIAEELPASAHEHRSWWANDITTGRHAMAWLSAGWSVADVDFSSETVTFRAGRQWDEPSFFDDLSRRQNQTTVEVARQILDWARGKKLRVWWGRGKENGSFIPVLDHQGVGHQLFAVYTYGTLEFYFQHHAYKPPFDAEEKRLELMEKLNTIAGVKLHSYQLTRRPSVSLEVFANDDARKQLFAVYEWFLDEIRRAV